LPVVAGLTLGFTQSSKFTLLVASGFLFSGLMFGPDLDLNSLPYKRWGFLRWIWLPYQKTLRHRSIWSHGLVIGTTIRVVYLLGCVAIALLLAFDICELLGLVGGWSWNLLAQEVKRSLFYHPLEWISLFTGLELGSMSHYLSDWGGSSYKRFKAGGIAAVMPKLPKAKKRKRKPSKPILKKRSTKTPKTRKKE
jgi:uncharacterized metal-binding protein